MRQIKRKFDYTNVTLKAAVDCDVEVDGKVKHFNSGDVVEEYQTSSKITKAKAAADFAKGKEYVPLVVELENVTETRQMSSETFIANSEVVEEPKEIVEDAE